MSSKNPSQKYVLVTGAAGFIGFHLCVKLLKEGYFVVGLDNLNDYYEVDLKYNRLKELGIDEAPAYNHTVHSSKYGNFHFIKLDLEDRENLPSVFGQYNFSKVCNLAAQAGVRYSLKNPGAYIDANIVGFLNLLECIRNFQIPKLVYASSSSVYGNNSKVPFSEADPVTEPVSVYAASKRSNELLAYTYHHLYGIQMIGLRFFTVYGPWGRPDMAIYLFSKAIIEDRPIKVFNQGNLYRDFTYIDDIIEGVFLTMHKEPGEKNYEIYNIGNSKPVKLMDFIHAIEKSLGKEAIKEYCEMQPGDVYKTWADVSKLTKDFDYHPDTPLQEGVDSFLDWLKTYSVKVKTP